MDEAHRLWCKLKIAEWQKLGHAPGTKWTLDEMKHVLASLQADNQNQRMALKDPC
jgi:hypothetical protein